MKRNIIEINEELCNGCNLCVDACHEGALKIINGKAKLVTDTYCDGLGDCLSECPTGAIKIIQRDALPYDEQAVQDNIAMNHNKKLGDNESCSSVKGGCPGSRIIEFNNTLNPENINSSSDSVSMLRQWPCQLKLISPNAQYFDNANVLIAADCTAYAYANIHEKFMKGKITLIGCPKLDDGEYSEKLTQILIMNNIKSLTILRMEVPCCRGIVDACKKALENSKKIIPWSIIVISSDGKIVNEIWVNF